MSKHFRRQANEAARQSVQAIAPKVDAALGNEEITRRRVESLERRAGHTEDRMALLTARMNALEARQGRGWWVRLVSLLRGI